ncbi:amino acid permease [Williamsia phyllosphaerae]|nr:amino acid permease [Williamsia phyllosphaerae]
MSVILLASLFATCLGMTNFAARYLQHLAGDKLMPSGFATLAQNGSPTRAVVAQIALVLLGVGGAGLLGSDPYLDTGAVLFGVGAVSVVLLQLIAAIAIVRFLHAHRPARRSQWWSRRIAPLLGLAGLAAAVVIIMSSFSTITGKSGIFYEVLPWLSVVAVVAGGVRGYLLDRRFDAAGDDTVAGKYT